MSKEHLLEIQITQPGRATGQYRPVDVDTLRLEKIIHPVAGMAVDVLTKWMHEARAVVPLVMLLERSHDPYFQVIGARGLGWLKARSAVPELIKLLLAEDQPYVSRITAAEALGEIGGQEAAHALEQATTGPRSNVVEAVARALEKLQGEKQDIQS